MISQTGQQIITIYKLSNISRSKTTKQFGELIEYNHLGKSYTKCGGEASPS